MGEDLSLASCSPKHYLGDGVKSGTWPFLPPPLDFLRLGLAVDLAVLELRGPPESAS